MKKKYRRVGTFIVLYYLFDMYLGIKIYIACVLVENGIALNKYANAAETFHTMVF